MFPRSLAAVALVSLTACASPPSQRRLADDAVAAMGGKERLQAIRVLVMKGGTGTRLRLGQTRSVGAPESPTPELKNVVETADLLNGRASLDYELKNGDFTQHRHEILTKRGEGATARPVGIEIVGTRPIVAMTPAALFSWGTQNSPDFLLRRNIVTVALAAAESTSEAQPAQDRGFNGRMLKFAAAKMRSGEEIGVYFDPQTKLIAGFEVNETETMLGDVPAQYVFGDYRAVDGITLPHRVTIRKGGQDYSDVQYSALSIDDPRALDVFVIPESASNEAGIAAAATDYTPLALTKVADGVYFARGYSHHSMVVEFPSFIAVVEAPYTETQSKVLARLIGEQFPNKPIRYAVVTHHHYDHTGGVRGLAALGATVLVDQQLHPVLNDLLGAPHSNPQDELDRQRTAQGKPPWKLEFIYDGKGTVFEGRQSIDFYTITGSPHAERIVLAYVPGARVLFQSDLWFPGTGGMGTPEARHLLDSVRKLGLAVETNIGGHGGVAPFSELVAAVEKMP